MNEKKSRDIALALLNATSTEEVNAAMKLDPAFADGQNWREYGDTKNNWDRISAQTSDPVGALGELIINSVDAILMRKAAENKVDTRGDNAPPA